MAFIDYYKILGVQRDIPQADIAKAYKKRVKQFHPDLHPEDPKAKAKFQALNEANAVLSDPEKRKKYDKYGQQWEQADAFEHASGGQNRQYYYSGNGGEDFDFSQFNGSGDFSSFFENIFGKHRTQQRVRERQYDAQSTIDLDLYTALLGGDILLQTQSGKIKLKIKPETLNGSKTRLRGKGFKKPDGTFGDLIITYNVVLPSHLTEHQRELLRQMRDGSL